MEHVVAVSRGTALEQTTEVNTRTAAAERFRAVREGVGRISALR